VRIAADTNILLRVILEDDPAQTALARVVMEQATLIAIPLPVFCELVWTMRRLYGRQTHEIADAIEAILGVASVVTDRLAVEAGVNLLRNGGDFADGAIAFLGAAMGGELFVTFDREAVRLLTKAGVRAQVPEPDVRSG
jgi:predicted nucleic-acid-binding protein